MVLVIILTVDRVDGQREKKKDLIWILQYIIQQVNMLYIMHYTGS